MRADVTDPIEQSRIRTLTFFRFAQENRELFRIVFGHGASFHDVVRRCQEGFIRDVLREHHRRHGERRPARTATR